MEPETLQEDISSPEVDNVYEQKVETRGRNLGMVKSPHKDKVKLEYIRWMANPQPEIILERSKYSKGDYWRKYIEKVYNNEVSRTQFMNWARELDDRIEEMKAISANLGELSNDEMAMRAATRRYAKAMLYKKLTDMLNNPALFDKITLKEARELYTAIRKEEDSDKMILLKAVEVKDKHDELNLFKEKLAGGFLPSNVISEIKTAITDIIHRHETNILDNGRNDNKYITS